jgi:uncharacterized repeat protein (TIGR01451 family)
VRHLSRPTVRLAISLIVLPMLLLLSTMTAYAEGSKDLIEPQPGPGGYRPFLLYDTIGVVGTIPNVTTIKVYAEIGEVLNMGSSANGLGAGVIQYESPTGVDFVCPVAGVVGRILSRVQENNGPFPGAGGYTPCQQAVNETGVWEVDFISPNPAAGVDNNPPPVLIANDNWVLNPPNDPDQPETVRWIRAWDITVTDGGVPIEGRVYADYLPLNMGNNFTGALVFKSIVHIFTEDGYLYRVGMNGIDAYGFQFLSNNRGFQRNNTPIFRSLQLMGGNSVQAIPPGFSLHPPTIPDTTENQTHKIFFNYPDYGTYDALNNALVPSASGPIAFQSPPIDPPVPSMLQFVGQEGTPGNAGTSPLQGVFTFNASGIGTYTIKLDVNNDGIFGNANDRILIGYAQTPGLQTVIWDGLDKFGDPVPAGAVGYDAQVEMYAGEVHFPFVDPENNVEGIVIERIIDPNTSNPEPPVGIVFWDDRYNYKEGGVYDYSICGEGDDIDNPPPPPDANVLLGCYGQPLDGREALNGVDSIALGGAHAWTGGFTEGFGNIRGMDTWSNYPSDPVIQTDVVFLREADLAVDKVHSPEPVAAGGPITFTITVSNYVGPSDAYDSTFYDEFPPEFLNITWTCEGFNSGVCETTAGTGSIPQAAPVVVDLPVGAYVVFTFDATIDPNIPPNTNLQNSATVLRPADVTDPTDPFKVGDGNNTDIDVINVQVASPTPTPSPTETPTVTPTNTPTFTPSETVVTATFTASNTLTGSETPTNTPNSSATATNTLTGSETATFTPNGSETATPVGPTPDTTLTPISPDPYITKSANPPFALPGDEVIWTITVVNPDPVAVTNVQVIDNLPAELQIISVRATAGEVFFYGQTVEFNIAVLNGGQTVTITVVTRVRDSAVPPYILRNLAVMTCDQGCDSSAQSTVTSAAALPATGESPWQALQIALIVGVLVAGAAGLWRYRTSQA